MYHGIAFLYKVHVTVASSCGNGLESDPPGRCCVGGLRIARAHLDQGRLLDGPQLLPLLSPHIIAPDAELGERGCNIDVCDRLGHRRQALRLVRRGIPVVARVPARHPEFYTPQESLLES